MYLPYHFLSNTIDYSCSWCRWWRRISTLVVQVVAVVGAFITATSFAVSISPGSYPVSIGAGGRGGLGGGTLKQSTRKAEMEATQYLMDLSRKRFGGIGGWRRISVLQWI